MIGYQNNLHAYTPCKLFNPSRSTASMLPRQINSPTGSSSSNKRGALKDHLAASSAFARLAGQAERLRHLQTLLESALPAHLALAARVANLKRGKVVIHADSGAVAVKLRQLAPRLAAGFIQQGQEVNGIEVKVQPSSRSLPKPSKTTHKTLGIRTKQSLTSLIAGLAPESPVRGALERLLKNT
jgi:hypothetical protein